MQKDHSLCVKALPFVFYCFSQFSKSTAILCGIDSAPLGQELDLKLSTTIEKKRKPSFSMQFLLLSISDVEEMSCVFIAYSFSWIWVCSGCTRSRRPQRYDPEMQDFPHNGSSAGDRNPFVISDDEGSGVLVPMPHTVCCTPDVGG